MSLDMVWIVTKHEWSGGEWTHCGVFSSRAAAVGAISAYGEPDDPPDDLIPYDVKEAPLDSWVGLCEEDEPAFSSEEHISASSHSEDGE